MQMRQIDNLSCKYSATVAIISLMKHHLEEVCEHLLSQPLPFDSGTRLCWQEIRNNDSIGSKVGIDLPIYVYTIYITYYI